ncbi:MAG: hypothetical protein GQ559_08330 [Desulfobulbaceae bacterium]|nr:hypothetical protein [Desulfobulbaceae bacterium]
MLKYEIIFERTLNMIVRQFLPILFVNDEELMKISITPEALRYISQKGSHVTLYVLNVPG